MQIRRPASRNKNQSSTFFLRRPRWGAFLLILTYLAGTKPSSALIHGRHCVMISTDLDYRGERAKNRGVCF